MGFTTKVAIPYFIQCHEEFLPLDRFDDSESVRHNYIPNSFKTSATACESQPPGL
jgi:hypothetical protein